MDGDMVICQVNACWPDEGLWGYLRGAGMGDEGIFRWCTCLTYRQLMQQHNAYLQKQKDHGYRGLRSMVVKDSLVLSRHASEAEPELEVATPRPGSLGDKSSTSTISSKCCPLRALSKPAVPDMTGACRGLLD